ncbi:hypothetical protein ABEO66_11670 [Bacillus pacificus]|uniref:hypothetical protein n=1 Tax=Bacillus pacificus TaxID=2026187 RepID=UPI003D219FB9
MKCPRVIIEPQIIEKILTELINEFIRIEKFESGLEYRFQSKLVMDKLILITSFLNEKWKWNEEKQSFYHYLKYITSKYELSGVNGLDGLYPC